MLFMKTALETADTMLEEMGFDAAVATAQANADGVHRENSTIKAYWNDVASIIRLTRQDDEPSQ